MQARNTRRAASAHAHAVKPDRAAGRAARRDAARTRRVQESRPLPWTVIVSAGLVLVVAFGFFAYLALRGNGSAAPAPSNPATQALVNSGDFNPNVPLKVGTVAPSFQLRDDVRFPYSLAAHRGHPVVLEFFALWCPHCHAEAPILNQIVKKYVPKGVTVWAILANQYGQYYESSGGRNVDLASHADIAWYASTYQTKYPLLIDPTFQTVNRYGQSGYPTIFMINSAGRIAYVHSGEEPFSYLSSKIDGLLGRAG